MLIDCDACTMRRVACQDCVVTVLLGDRQVPAVPGVVDLDAAEEAALAVLAGSGLVPPLRLRPAGPASRRVGETPEECSSQAG